MITEQFLSALSRECEEVTPPEVEDVDEDGDRSRQSDDY